LLWLTVFIIDSIIQDRLFVLAKEKRGMGENKVRGFIKILIEDGKIKEEPIKRQGATYPNQTFTGWSHPAAWTTSHVEPKRSLSAVWTSSRITTTRSHRGTLELPLVR
jgi:hypothetical protein